VKLARAPDAARLTMQRYGLLGSLAMEFAEPDWNTLPLLAREWDLSAYDAAYLQLALARRAPLITLDARLARAYDLATR
jgi:predicted nucleic acid-binding protein